MSDYIFHPRLEARSDMWLKKYYLGGFNPYFSMQTSGDETEYYAWGRFWEIYDMYLENQPAPNNLGYIEEKITEYSTGTTTTNYRYEDASYWSEADKWDDFDDPNYLTLYYNTDNYMRFGAGGLGDVVIFGDVTYEYGVSYQVVAGVVEKTPDNNHGWLISFYTENDGFFIIETPDQEDIEYINGVRLPFIDAIGNPIWNMYDDIIEGHPLYWKGKFWLYKRYLDRRRGLLYD